MGGPVLFTPVFSCYRTVQFSYEGESIVGIAEFFQHLMNGLTLGGIYALIALGYTMVYGILKFINFAHGDVLMVGAYVGCSSLTCSGVLPRLACGRSLHSL